MFEQDYIMRLIKEMIRMVLKLLFHIDTNSPTEELLNITEEKETINTLLELVDGGFINEAENRIYELTSDGNTEALKTALLFYAHLNEKTDDFLKEHDFSRKEIKEDLMGIMSKYGLEDLTELFMSD